MLTIIVLSVSLLGASSEEKSIHTTWESCEAAKITAVNQQGYNILKGAQEPLKIFQCAERKV